MMNIWSFIAVAILLTGICASADREYESGTGEPYEGSALEMFQYNTGSSDSDSGSVTLSGEDLHPKKREIATTASSDGEQSSSSTESVKDKSDTTPTSSAKPNLLVSDILDHVEGALIQSALSVVKYVKGTQNATDVDHVEKIPSETLDKTKRSLAPEDASSENDAIFKFVTSRSVPATGDVPARFVVDKVAVSEVKPGLGSLISSLDFHVHPSIATVATTTTSPKEASVTAKEDKLTASSTHTTVTAAAAHIQQIPTQSTNAKVEEAKDAPKALVMGEPVSPTEKDITAALSASTMAISTATASSSAATPSAATSASPHTASDASVSPSTTTAMETAKAATTPAPTSAATTTTTTTTTKNPIEKLKEAEDDLKEKVTEIEAEPIIFSARV